MGKTADTHHLEPLEKTTFGKTYFVVDDQKHVWAADLPYNDAVRQREIVAGCGWSKTPAVREMPADPKARKKIVSLVRGPDGAAPTAQPTPAAELDLDALLTESESATVTNVTITNTPPPPTNGSGEPHEGGSDDGDDDLGDLLDA